MLNGRPSAQLSSQQIEARIKQFKATMPVETPAYESIKDDSSIATLAKAAMKADLAALQSNLESARKGLYKMIQEDEEVPQADKHKEFNEALSNYVNKPEPKLNGRTPLMLVKSFPVSTGAGFVAIERLINFGANPNAKDYQGNTLMHLYAIEGLTDVIATSVKQDYHPDSSKTITQISKECADRFERYVKYMAFLCNQGANPNITNNNDWSVIDVLQYHFPDIANTLQEEYSAFLVKNRSTRGEPISPPKKDDHKASSTFTGKEIARRAAPAPSSSCCTIL